MYLRPEQPRLYQVPSDLHMMTRDLLNSDEIHRREWQAMDVSASKMHATHELTDVTLWMPEIPRTQGELAVMTEPDLPWAEEHFGERVSGVPFNPAPSHVRWPYAVRNNADHQPDGVRFDHTYPERFWPKWAGKGDGRDRRTWEITGNLGVRFAYGDLNDVVALLKRNPATRQAYLPVWFPEDTGGVASKNPDALEFAPTAIRVPCTLGYHFMTDVHGRLSCRYYIRSCDVYRHLVNDIYLAARLTQWVCQQVNHAKAGLTDLFPGSLVMYVSSLHAFVGDVNRIEKKFLGE